MPLASVDSLELVSVVKKLYNPIYGTVGKIDISRSGELIKQWIPPS